MKYDSLTQVGFRTGESLLLVFPHPDDETPYAAGLVQQALALGVQVELIVLTNGSKTTLRHGLRADENIVAARASELQKALEILGVTQHQICDFPDKELTQKSDSVEAYLSKIFAIKKPQWVLTYEEDGVSGQPDHIALAKILVHLHKHRRNFNLLQALNPQEDPQKPYLNLKLPLQHSYKKWRPLRAHRSQFGNMAKIFNHWVWQQPIHREKFLIHFASGH